MSARDQELSVQTRLLKQLGVDEYIILLDHGYAASNLNRPGLARAVDRLREGDTFVVTKFDRLVRSVPHAHSVA
ncbi:recombinase family protein [Corynebacterium liangguodongii]|uniref:Uncharacterized protein n=1 Tax=Corynebacterium liangguodongii TaxID=2079535 RepID=A0A2S0WG92_9CORY|nr:recombinase family protein [Corynebacterium liangguodongii]AWB84744.1 hypothetical protein C3E79_09885 [Corynebacterium liangguodongii]PWB99752.1 hypothetical protein DF219_05665 [Corynebacterium liangguodongii]